MERERSRERGHRRFNDDDRGLGGLKRRTPRFVLPADAKIDYKDLPLLQKFITDSGKIMSRRITGVNGKQNRQVSVAVKRARFLALLSAVNRH